MCGHAFDSIGSFFKDVVAPVGEVVGGILDPAIIPFEAAGALAGGLSGGGLGGAVTGAGFGAAAGGLLDSAGVLGNLGSEVSDTLGITGLSDSANNFLGLGTAGVGSGGGAAGDAAITAEGTLGPGAVTAGGASALAPVSGGVASAASTGAIGSLPGVGASDLTSGLSFEQPIGADISSLTSAGSGGIGGIGGAAGTDLLSNTGGAGALIPNGGLSNIPLDPITASVQPINGLSPAASGANFNQITGNASGLTGNDLYGNVPSVAGGTGGSSSGGLVGKGLSSLGVGPETSAAIGNNAGTIISGLGLAKDLLTPTALTGVSNLQSEAASLQNGGNSLTSYLTNGTLPPGVQTSINTATKAAQAAVRSKYASMGMSGSTAEQQEINSITQTASTQGFQIADTLLQQGINETQLSAQLYQDIINVTAQQNAATGQAIANLASSLSGGSGNNGRNIVIPASVFSQQGA